MPTLGMTGGRMATRSSTRPAPARCSPPMRSNQSSSTGASAGAHELAKPGSASAMARYAELLPAGGHGFFSAADALGDLRIAAVAEQGVLVCLPGIAALHRSAI